MKPLLIAFTGKSGAGKDTAAEFLTNQRYYHESFARRAKEGMKVMFGLTFEQVFGDFTAKEAAIPHLSKKKPVCGRLLLQTGCTEWARNMIDEDIWIYPVAAQYDTLKSIPGFAGMVITDLRFNNEAEWIKSQGGLIIEVKDTRGIRITPTISIGDHVSESGIDPRHIDAVLANDFSGKDILHGQLKSIIDDLMKTEIKIYDKEPPTKKPCPCDNDSNIKEVRKLITDWADSVFPDRTINNAISKLMLHEIPEYMMKQDDPMELADIGILLYDIAHLAGIDLDKAIREKMAINMSRRWAIDDRTGLMSHIKPSNYADVQAAESEGGEV